MDLANDRLLRDEMQPFLARHDVLAFLAVFIDFVIYFGATALAVIVEPVWQKALFSVLAGTIISTLFVLGHDAAHGALVAKRWQNRVLGRILMFPALHNYSLWLIQHNRLHHQFPNVKGCNSWSPLSVTEYQALRPWRKFLERVYRGGGFGIYYLVERWWKDKFIPFNDVDPKARRDAWRDFALIAIWLVGLASTLVLLGRAPGRWSPLSALFWGFVLPFAVWNTLMGLTTFMQHTHPAAPWFRTSDEAGAFGGQEKRTTHIMYPRWYDLLSHNIMVHTPHHINPRIPFYRLNAAQARLVELLGNDAIVAKFGPRYLLSLLRCCKLYDYDRREWLDFAGRTTGQMRAVFLVREGTEPS